MGQAAVEIVGCADQREMGEGLEKVSGVLAARSDLFRKQSQMIGVAESFIKDESSLIQFSHACKSHRESFAIHEWAREMSASVPAAAPDPSPPSTSNATG
jgi:hypothetical protein